MFEEEGEVGLEGEGSPGEGREPDDSDVLQVVQDNVVLGEGAAEFLEGLGHGTGGHVADPELEGGRAAGVPSDGILTALRFAGPVGAVQCLTHRPLQHPPVLERGVSKGSLTACWVQFGGFVSGAL